jgi:hypothetical protein
MDKQAIFDKVYTHLMTQKKRAARRERIPSIYGVSHRRAICQYRAADGLRCAVGALIPDELYDPWMDEAGSVFALFGDGRSAPLAGHLGLNLDSEEELDFLANLQYIHDQNKPSLWRRKLNRLAKDAGLTVPAVSA